MENCDKLAACKKELGKMLRKAKQDLVIRTSEDRSGPLVTCTGNTGRSPVLTGELVPVDWHRLPVQVTNGPDWSSEVLIASMNDNHTNSRKFEKILNEDLGLKSKKRTGYLCTITYRQGLCLWESGS